MASEIFTNECRRIHPKQLRRLSFFSQKRRVSILFSQRSPLSLANRFALGQCLLNGNYKRYHARLQNTRPLISTVIVSLVLLTKFEFELLL